MTYVEPELFESFHDPTWTFLADGTHDMPMADSCESPGRWWPSLQYTDSDMSSTASTRSLSPGQQFSLLHETSSMHHNLYSSATPHYSASPQMYHHPMPIATQAIAIPPVLPQLRTASIDGTSCAHSHSHRRSVSEFSYAANACVSPTEYTSSFSFSDPPDSSNVSRSSTGDSMPIVRGHGLSSFDDNTLKCFCGSEFRGAKAKNIRSNFKRHLKTKGTQIRCPQCDKVFNRQDNVQQHIRTRHPKESPLT